MELNYFLHQIKHTSNEFNKGISVSGTFDAAKQGYHAYLGAYAYGHEQNTDFVQCIITDSTGSILLTETWYAYAEEPVQSAFFVHEIKGGNGVITNKGIVVSDTYDAAKQGYHAYLGAYAYGHDPQSDFVSCAITNMMGDVLMEETWIAPAESEPEEV